jgi:hypothetical protein
MPIPASTPLTCSAGCPPSCSGRRAGSAGVSGRARALPLPPRRPPPPARGAPGPKRRTPTTTAAAGGRGGDDYGDGLYDAFEPAWRPARLGEGGLDGSYGRAGAPSQGPPDFWSAASADDDGVLAEAAALAASASTPPSSLGPPGHRASPLTPPGMGGGGGSGPSSSPLVPDDALLAAAPGTQAARLRDLQAAAAARRDVHWAMYRAHSAKANLLATAVLLCTTAGGTSGLVSLIGGGPGGGGAGGMSPLAPAWGPPQQWSPPPQQSQQLQGLYGSGYGGFTAPAPGPSTPAPQPAGVAPGPTQPPTAALLAPVLGYAATLMSGWQSYSKPSTAASRHLTAFKRYQLLARHARDALAYGRAAALGRVIQAVERKIDQYCDESPVIGLGEPVDGGGGSGSAAYPPPPSPGRAFWMALTELPE